MRKLPKQKSPCAARKPKPAVSRKKPCPPKNAPVPRDPDIPHWLPAGDRWNDLPQNIRDAVPRILAPAYRRFVLDAPNELERSIGLTLVHLIWLELCGQVQLSLAAADPNCLDAILQNPDDMIDRHLRLATVKCQTTELLVKLRVVNEALQRPQPTYSPRPLVEGPNEMSPLPLGEGQGVRAVKTLQSCSFNAPSQIAPLHLEGESHTEPEIGKTQTC